MTERMTDEEFEKKTDTLHYLDDPIVAEARRAREAEKQLEEEAEAVARVLAHMSGAITGHLKPHVPYPKKPIRPVEEGLVIYRAAQILAGKLFRIREGREPTDVEIQGEVIWSVKLAEKEIESINPGRPIYG